MITVVENNKDYMVDTRNDTEIHLTLDTFPVNEEYSNTGVAIDLYNKSYNHRAIQMILDGLTSAENVDINNVMRIIEENFYNTYIDILKVIRAIIEVKDINDLSDYARQIVIRLDDVSENIKDVIEPETTDMEPQDYIEVMEADICN